MGEAGVGKSRLIYEFVRSEPVSDWRILEIRNGIVRDGDQLPAGNGIPERVFSDRGLRRLLGGPGEGDRKAPEPRRKPPASLPVAARALDLPQDEPGSSNPASPQRRRSTLEAMRRLLFRESEVATAAW